MLLQVRVEIEQLDRVNNFVCWLFLANNTNLSVELVKHGHAKTHFSASRTPYYGALTEVEEKAKAKRIGVCHYAMVVERIVWQQCSYALPLSGNRLMSLRSYFQIWKDYKEPEVQESAPTDANGAVEPAGGDQGVAPGQGILVCLY